MRHRSEPPHIRGTEQIPPHCHRTPAPCPSPLAVVMAGGGCGCVGLGWGSHYRCGDSAGGIRAWRGRGGVWYTVHTSRHACSLENDVNSCSLPVSTIQHHVFFRIAGHFLELSRYADSTNETVSCQPIIPLPDCPPWTNYFSSATLKPYTNPLLHCGSSSSGVGIARGCRNGLTPCAPPTNKIMFTELRDGHKFTIGCMCHNVVLPTCQYSTVQYRRGAWY